MKGYAAVTFAIQNPPPPAPPHGNGNHPACRTPNPPWWCDDAPEMSIDMGVGIMLLFGLAFGYLILRHRKK